jgi:1,2-diacylglycerol 3-alpha-glucosyltransferase
MKICMFTNTYLPHVGGVARSVSFFAQDLRRAGNDVLVIAPTFPDCEAHDAKEPDVFRVPAIQQFNGSDFSVHIPSPFLVDEKMDAFEPQILHSHHPYLLGDTALRAARRRIIPLIFTHHTLYEEYTHYISNTPGKMKRFAAFLSTNYANLCDRVVAPSKSVEKLISDRGVTVPITEIPTGVDTAAFSEGDGAGFRKSHRIPSDAFVIGHLGRLAPEKNLAYLAAAVVRALDTHPHARFLVVGDGPSRKKILQTFDNAGLSDRLIMAGQMSGPDLMDAYHAMDLFAFASQSETQGMVLTEAMAAKVPVVALDAPGAREVVRDGENGRLLEDDTPEGEFAQALCEAIAEPAASSKWPDGARDTAAAFGRERSAKKMLALYTDAIDARKENGAYETQDLDAWDKFLLACRSEWDLIAQKTETVLQALDDEKKVVDLDETA